MFKLVGGIKRYRSVADIYRNHLLNLTINLRYFPVVCGTIT